MQLILVLSSIFLTHICHSETYCISDGLVEESCNAQEEKDPETKEELKKGTIRTESQVGKVKLTIDVENTDFSSQCQAEWKKQNPKKEEKKTDTNKKKEEKEENYDPKTTIKFSWSSDN
jgi:hypothetical protein